MRRPCCFASDSSSSFTSLSLSRLRASSLRCRPSVRWILRARALAGSGVARATGAECIIKDYVGTRNRPNNTGLLPDIIARLLPGSCGTCRCAGTIVTMGTNVRERSGPCAGQRPDSVHVLSAQRERCSGRGLPISEYLAGEGSVRWGSKRRIAMRKTFVSRRDFSTRYGPFFVFQITG